MCWLVCNHLRSTFFKALFCLHIDMSTALKLVCNAILFIYSSHCKFWLVLDWVYVNIAAWSIDLNEASWYVIIFNHLIESCIHLSMQRFEVSGMLVATVSSRLLVFSQCSRWCTSAEEFVICWFIAILRHLILLASSVATPCQITLAFVFLFLDHPYIFMPLKLAKEGWVLLTQVPNKPPPTYVVTMYFSMEKIM